MSEETEFADIEGVANILKSHDDVALVTAVHCETSTGVINPVTELGQVVRQHAPKASYFVDAMSSFGAVPLEFDAGGIDYLVSSANKCIEGVPGFSYVIANREKLAATKGNARSLSFDLLAQDAGLNSGGQFRFTPATHAMVAFRQALREFEAEGGLLSRAARYQANRAVLREGMARLGFRELLSADHKGYIITSFHYPQDPAFHFGDFYERLNAKDLVIYPGKVSVHDCFRIGSIGHLQPEDFETLIAGIEDVCRDMGMAVPVQY